MKTAQSVKYTTWNKLFFALFFFVGCNSVVLASNQSSFINVLKYRLFLHPNIEEKTLKGNVEMVFENLNANTFLLLDLKSYFTIDSIKYMGRSLDFNHQNDSIKVFFANALIKNRTDSIIIYYHGKPQEAVKPPWDGGFSWEKDKKKNPWVAVSCQGIGASVWWPCKDDPADEPDLGVEVKIVATKKLTAVSNGKLVGVSKYSDKESLWHWVVNSSINLYCVTLNIGKYDLFEMDYFSAADGNSHKLQFYVLGYRTAKAKKHFQQTDQMLRIYEELFGEYPFWKDGFKVVETPFWGMEHQSAIAYGNNYKNNAAGFDFILIHESGHEWFGNSISCADNAELWIHESFTTYMEALYLEKIANYKTASLYLQMQRERIESKQPMIGDFGVRFDSHDLDIYYKGAWMLHGLRTYVENDSLWFSCLKSFYQTHKHSYVNSDDVIDFFSEFLGKDLDAYFNEYLLHAKIPAMNYRIEKKGKNRELVYWLESSEKNFQLPIYIKVGKEEIKITPKAKPQRLSIQQQDVPNLQIPSRDYLLEIHIN